MKVTEAIYELLKQNKDLMSANYTVEQWNIKKDVDRMRYNVMSSNLRIISQLARKFDGTPLEWEVFLEDFDREKHNFEMWCEKHKLED